ncbi:aspartate/glutamate racemase family protein [Phytohabitans suffuscus]|uniref:Asp/Glu/hydantoin racemase n=1 Tax=Phytohabitans suffuscus TaxID=624315 RepID=A0A6F8YDT2_9ACTN|nr:aspartate/glutamate racemase family protein [Phytohabitans suffuscus]BCB84220.1 hypothetical protein Psuf_015330 [Phytohabitans suffuscus]
MSTRVRIVVPLRSTWDGDATVISSTGGLRLEVDRMAGVPQSLEAAYDVARVERQVVDRVVAARDEGVDAVVVRCMRDVGVRAAREIVGIPVVGPAQATFQVACMLGRRFSVLVTLPRSIEVVEDQIRKWGLRHRFASARALDVPVQQLHDDEELLLDRMGEQAQAAVEHDGAHVVVLGCTAMQGAGAAVERRLARAGQAGVPVIEPLSLSVRLAGVLAQLGLSGSSRTHPAAAEFIRQAQWPRSRWASLPPLPEDPSTHQFLDVERTRQ